MTKKEYEKLLKSDYWRGYSYSLIKERNFTCEDCGRRFPNERNKLQVHHLVYRDVNPWSYKPEEVVVLCEECHKKRHGIYTEPVTGTITSSLDKGNIDENAHPFNSTTTGIHFDTRAVHADNINSRFAWPEEKEKRFKFKYVIYGLLALLALSFGYDKLYNQEQQKENVEETQRQIEEQEEYAPNISNQRSTAKRKSVTTKRSVPTEETTPMRSEPNSVQSEYVEEPLTTTQKAVSEPKSAYSSSDEELSTTELLERKTHANVVEQAKRAGVSTEGSTSDILERITHANVVKQAKRAGVSTEDSTSDILERITHANVVKQAKRAGVSTEGSTSDILERITRKNLESR